MNTKRKGNRNEHRSRRLLESDGYAVIRSAASRSPFDLIAFNSFQIMLVQVKTGKFPSKAELEAILLFPAPPNTTKIIHRWRDHARFPDVRLVRSANH